MPFTKLVWSIGDFYWPRFRVNPSTYIEHVKPRKNNRDYDAPMETLKGYHKQESPESGFDSVTSIYPPFLLTCTVVP